MIDERQEELASLYAFGLLEGAELASFEAALARDPALQTLVRQLREASAALARTPSQNRPPAELRRRVLASAVAAAAPEQPDNVVRPSPKLWRLVPWAAAACLALAAAWFSVRQVTTQSEIAALRDRSALADIALKSAEQQLEAERIVTRKRLGDLQQQFAGANAQLGDTRSQLGERDRLLAETRTQLTERDRLLAERDRQIADFRSQLNTRQQEVVTLTQRIAALAGESAALGSQLGESKQRLAQLTAELKSQGDLAQLKIATLASMLKNSPKALAVAVWDPKKQEGVLTVENLPALAANEDYQLWIVDPQYPNPVDGGVFTVEPASGQRRLQFKAQQPVSAINAFAVTRERKGGVPKAQGPFVLLGK